MTHFALFFCLRVALSVKLKGTKETFVGVEVPTVGLDESEDGSMARGQRVGHSGPARQSHTVASASAKQQSSLLEHQASREEVTVSVSVSDKKEEKVEAEIDKEKEKKKEKKKQEEWEENDRWAAQSEDVEEKGWKEQEEENEDENEDEEVLLDEKEVVEHGAHGAWSMLQGNITNLPIFVGKAPKAISPKGIEQTPLIMWSECWPMKLENLEFVSFDKVETTCGGWSKGAKWTKTQGSYFGKKENFPPAVPRAPFESLTEHASSGLPSANLDVALMISKGSFAFMGGAGSGDCQLHWNPKSASDFDQRSKALTKELEKHFEAYHTQRSTVLQNAFDSLFQAHLERQQRLIEGIGSKIQRVFNSKTPEDLSAAGWQQAGSGFTHVASKKQVASHPTKDEDGLRLAVVFDHTTEVDAAIQKLQDDMKKILSEKQPELISQSGSPGEKLVQDIRKVVLDYGQRTAIKNIKKYRSPAKPSNTGICFSQDGTWANNKYCICPILDRTWNDHDYVAAYGWLSRLRKGAKDEGKGFVDKPEGVLAHNKEVQTPELQLTSLQDDGSVSVSFGGKEYFAHFVGPFDLIGHSHGVFEVVAPTSQYVVGIKQTRSRDTCFLHLYEAKDSMSYMMRAEVVAKAQQQLQYLSYLQGGAEMALARLGDAKIMEGVMARKGGANPSPEMASSSFLESGSNSSANAAAALQSLYSSFENAMDQAVEVSNHGESLLHMFEMAMGKKLEDAKKQNRSISVGMTAAEESETWMDIQMHLESHVCLAFMGPPGEKWFWKNWRLGREKAIETVGLADVDTARTGLEGKNTRCILANLLQRVLSNTGEDSEACLLQCMPSLGMGDKKKKKKNEVCTSDKRPLGKCEVCTGKGDGKGKGKGSCNTKKSYPQCPLKPEVIEKLRQLWTKMDEKFKNTKGKTCRSKLLASGLWVPRPDKKLKFAGLVDLTSYGEWRKIEATRIHEINSDQIQLKLNESVVVTLSSDSKFENIHQGADFKGAEWVIPRQGGLMDSLFIKLQKRIEMCRVQKLGLFNIHFEATGSVGAEIGTYFGKQNSHGQTAALLISKAAMTIYKVRKKKKFAGHDMGDAIRLFGDPLQSSDPKAWWKQMQKNVQEGGWEQNDDYGEDICLLCSPSFDKMSQTGGNFHSLPGKCEWAEEPVAYVNKDPDGDAPIPRFLHWTKKAKRDLVEKHDYRGLWTSKKMIDHLLKPGVMDLNIQAQYVTTKKVTNYAWSIATSSVIGVSSYDKDQAKKDSHSEFVKGGAVKEKPGFDYDLDLLHNCFTVSMYTLPEETLRGWKLGDYTRMRLCTNHFDGRFDKSKNMLRPAGLPPVDQGDVYTSRADIETDLLSFVGSVAPVEPREEDGADLGKEPSGTVGQPQCFAVAEADRDANTCLAGLDLIGFESPCVENPEDACPEGTKCKCDTGFDTLGGKAKFALAFLTVQTTQFGLWYFTFGSAQLALATQAAAGPSDLANSFILLTLVEGKKQCKCVGGSFPMIMKKKETKTKGCLYVPQKMHKGKPGEINHLNPYWFMPKPGTKHVPERMRAMKGALVGGIGTFFAMNAVPGVDISPEVKNFAIAGAAAGGLVGSFWLADCHTRRCEEGEDKVGFIDGKGFANCVGSVAHWDFDQRVKYYDEKLSSDKKLQMVKEGLRKRNMTLSVHQMWDIALRMDFPEHFGMPEGMLGRNKDAYFMSTLKYLTIGNPAAKMVGSVLSAGLEIVEEVGTVVFNSLKIIGRAIRYPFLTKTKKLTMHKILSYYYEECMGIECHAKVTPTMSLDMPIFRKTLKWKSKKTQCKSLLYEEESFDELKFQEARLSYMLKNMKMPDSE